MKKFLDNLIDQGKISVSSSELAQNMLREAYQFAYDESTDSTTKNGAVIVKDGNIASKGTNRYAKGVEITKKRSTPVAERVYQDHSERNAIYGAARLGIPLEDTDMYSTWIPCPVCANGIINSGIKRVIFHYEAAVRPHKKYWRDELKESALLMLEAGIELVAYKGKVGGVKGVFHKKEWEP